MEEKIKQLNEKSNMEIAQLKAFEYLGNDAKLYVSSRKNKKYMIYDPNINKWIHFGDIRYKDFTYTGDNVKRRNYLQRSANIKGNWKDNLYSPNNLSINILW